jgi:hypothetical protein
MLTESIRRVPPYVVKLFFGVLLGLGGLVFSDYGVSWDEESNRTNGMVNVRYIGELVAPNWMARQPRHANVPLLAGYSDNDHGVLFELPLAALDALRGDPDRRHYYLLRHAAIFLVSLGGLWGLFRLASLRFHDERLGLLAAGLLVLSPRFFAESFYNGKDLVFMATFTLAIYTLTCLMTRPSTRRVLVHALATAAAVDIRVMGLLLVPFTLTLLGLRWTHAAGTRRKWLRAGLLYIPLVAGAVVMGWPYLWANPLGHFQAALGSLGHYHWIGEVLYGGRVILSNNLPWHYVPVWISITTPVAYQLAALGGMGISAASLLRQPRTALRTTTGQFDLLLLGWLGLPLALVLGLHSVIYDGWRHLYFIYPALLLFAVRGIVAVAQVGQRGLGWHRISLGLGLLAGGEAVLTAVRMVRLHPYQQLYFSYLPSTLVERSFERDYWGLSYREGLSYLVAHQPKGPIPLAVSSTTLLENNKVWLAPADRIRFVKPTPNHDYYFITSYRAIPGNLPANTGQEIFTVRTEGIKILSVFQHRAVSAR